MVQASHKKPKKKRRVILYVMSSIYIIKQKKEDDCLLKFYIQKFYFFPSGVMKFILLNQVFDLIENDSGTEKFSDYIRSTKYQAFILPCARISYQTR